MTDNEHLFRERDPHLVERERTHGSFLTNGQIYIGMKNEFYNHGVPKTFKDSQTLALDMIFMKLSRLRQNPNVKDHWDDIAGYAKLGAEACD